MRSIAVFCGGSSQAKASYKEAAAALGRRLAESGTVTVYGGGRVGLMGVVADAALAAGGEVIGVIPRHLVERELAHTRLTELRVVETMLERKALMAELSDAFVSLPGGFGTLDELFEMLTWTQIGVQQKPSALLNIDGYWDSILAWTERAVADGLLRPAHQALLVAEPSVEAVLERLTEWRLPAMPALGS